MRFRIRLCFIGFLITLLAPAVVFATVFVTTPKAGETLEQYGSYPIAWYTNGVAQRVNIYLMKGGQVYQQLAGNVPTNPYSKAGSFSWQVANTAVIGKDYQIKIVGAVSTAESGVSPLFGIGPYTLPSLTLTQPAAGAVVAPGMPVNIAWSQNKVAPATVLKLTVSLPNGIGTRDIATFAAGDRSSYGWTVPADIIPGHMYSFSLSNIYNAQGQTSVTARVAPITIYNNNPPASGNYLFATAPLSGFKAERGGPLNIAWRHGLPQGAPLIITLSSKSNPNVGATVSNKTVLAGPNGSGNLTFQLPPYLIEGNDYTLEFGMEGKGLLDSISGIQIVQPQFGLSILEPRQGETIELDAVRQLKWQFSGPSSTLLDIYYEPVGGPTSGNSGGMIASRVPVTNAAAALPAQKSAVPLTVADKMAAFEAGPTARTGQPVKAPVAPALIQGSYNWDTANKGIKPGQYYIRIQANNNFAQYAKTGAFAIDQTTIKITEPVASSIWKPNDRVTIGWKYHAVPPGNKLKIVLYQTGVVNPKNYEIASNLDAPAQAGEVAGSYTWTVPATFESGTYKMYMEFASHRQYTPMNVGYAWSDQFKVDGVVKPKIVNFDAASATDRTAVGKNFIYTTSGTPVTLSWDLGQTVYNSAEIAPGVGPITKSVGSVTVSPTSQSQYTLTVKNSAGEASQFLYVLAGSPAKVFSFSCIGTVTNQADGVVYLKQGQIGELRWGVDYGWDSFVITPINYSKTRDKSQPNSADNGSTGVTPTQLTTYTLTAKNMFGSDSKSCAIAPLPATSVAEFSVTPSSIKAGQTATLTWKLNGLAGYIGGNVNPGGPFNGSSALPSSSGSVTVSPQLTTTYTLEAYGPDGRQAPKTTTIQVVP